MQNDKGTVVKMIIAFKELCTEAFNFIGLACGSYKIFLEIFNGTMEGNYNENEIEVN